MPYDLLSSAWRVTVDGVMGGQSRGSVTALGGSAGVRFEGYLDTDGGGFVYISRSGMSGLDLEDRAGFFFELGSLDAAVVGNAPLSFQVELEGGGGCCGELDRGGGDVVPDSDDVEPWWCNVER